ncbi:cell division protein SepF [bacterium]|nr:cell division protein SepF [bacterium]
MTVQDTIQSFVKQITGVFEPQEEIYTQTQEILPYGTDRNLALDTAAEMKSTNIKPVDQSKVVAFNKNNTEVMICEPRTYGESVEFVKYLKDKKSIIVNLHLLETADALRLVDFLCGATHALNGNMHKISDNVFIFTPMNVALSAESQGNKIVKDVLWE